MSNEHFLEIFPCRNTVKKYVSDEAVRAKSEMKKLFAEAIKQGGLGCTLDLGSDRYQSNSYLAMTANVFLLRSDCIEHKGVIFHMGLIPDLVKSKDVIKSRIWTFLQSLALAQMKLRILSLSLPIGKTIERYIFIIERYIFCFLCA